MPSKFTLQELILIINNRADIFEIRPMLDLFVKKIIPFTSIDEFSASAVSVAKYVIGINASKYVPQLQSWASSFIPAENRPELKAFQVETKQQFDHEIEAMSLFVGIALLVSKQDILSIRRN